MLYILCIDQAYVYQAPGDMTSWTLLTSLTGPANSAYGTAVALYDETIAILNPSGASESGSVDVLLFDSSTNSWQLDYTMIPEVCW